MMTERERRKFHPGYFFKQELEALEMTPAEFAKRSGILEKQVSDLLNQKIGITPLLADKLGAFFGSSAIFWTGLQMDYDAYQKRQQYQAAINGDYRLLLTIDKSFRLSHVAANLLESKEAQVLVARARLEVGSLQYLDQKNLYALYKEQRTSEAPRFLKNVWLSLAMRMAREEDDLTFNEETFKRILVNFKSYTSESPEQFYPQLQNDFKKAGAHFVFLSYLPKSDIYGATKWIDSSNSPVIALSNRSHSNDLFWFSLFHEASHVLMQHKKNMLETTKETEMLEIEKQADEMAADLLIDRALWNAFVARKSFTKMDIQVFAKKAGVHPGIVVGRLQKEKHLKYSVDNGLKVQYRPESFHL
jgi:HTH-type transcriptional regulator/antitoxin HigA